MTRIWWILIWALKSLKHLHFDWSLVCKVYNVWPKQVQRSIFHDTEESCKIWRKTCMWFGKWLEEFSKCQNWYFHGIPLFKVENAWATNYMSYRGFISNDTEEWWKIWREIDIRNLMNFDPRTCKSQKFTLSWAAFDEII